jgi:hypothetical protein
MDATKPRDPAQVQAQAALPLPDTAAPARNFSLSIEDRIRAFAQGPLAYMRRLRTIEDLRERLVRRFAAAGDDAWTVDEMAADLARLNELIERHNRYYPIEANLPVDPRTGRLLERGVPWRPLARVTFEDLAAAA